MTPYELSILLHISTTSLRYDGDDTKLYEETINLFKLRGVIVQTNDTEHKCALTKKGEAWIECILNTKEPVQAWIDEQGRIIM